MHSQYPHTNYQYVILEPQFGERLSKSVTIRFIVPDVVCLKDDDELALIVRNFIVPQLITESLCEHRTARACQEEYIVPYCGGKPDLKKRRRRRQSGETLLDVDIEVSSEVNNNTTVLQGKIRKKIPSLFNAHRTRGVIFLT